MDLVFKLYTDKPSKIGVKYIHEYAAIKEYEALISKYRGETFRIQVEFQKEKVHMTLRSEDTGVKVVYKDLECKKEDLKKFHTVFKPGLDLEFVHVFMKANAMMVARPYRLAEFLKVSSFEIIGLPGQLA